MNDIETYQTTEEIYELARSLMNGHGVVSWKFKFHNSNRRVGNCCHTEKTISLSKQLILACSKTLVLDTVLHEIAHAITGKNHGHDRKWKINFLRLGGSGNRLADTTQIDFSKIKFGYIGKCPNGHTHYRARKPKEGSRESCGLCSKKFDANFLITYEKQ